MVQITLTFTSHRLITPTLRIVSRAVQNGKLCRQRDPSEGSVCTAAYGATEQVIGVEGLGDWCTHSRRCGRPTEDCRGRPGLCSDRSPVCWLSPDHRHWQAFHFLNDGAPNAFVELDTVNAGQQLDSKIGRVECLVPTRVGVKHSTLNGRRRPRGLAARGGRAAWA